MSDAAHVGHLRPRSGASIAPGRRALVLALTGVLALMSSAGPAFAADEPDVKWAYDLAHELMSPFCPGRTLAECPSPNAAELRLWIINQAAAGASEEEVREMIYERFGEVVRSTPKTDDGWGLSAYAVPIGFFVLGGPVVVWIIRRLMRSPDSRGGEERPVAPAASAAALSAADRELERQLERELGEL